MLDGLVSTIIPVYNRPLLLRDAVASVLAQGYRPIEIIIVDDGSTDETPSTIKQLQCEHPHEITSIRIANGGAGLAREAGRQLARGSFIQYLDSDDLLLPQKFALQVAGLIAHPECGVAYGKTRCYRMGEQPTDRACKRTGERIATMFPSFLQSRWWDTSTPLYRRAVTDRAGAWTPLTAEEDWEYDCRIASSGVQLIFCDSFVSDTRSHTGAMLSTNGLSAARLMDRAEAHVLIMDHARTANIPTSTPEMQHYARELFLLARQCGAVGLVGEARRLFTLARDASGPDRARGVDFLAYRVAAALLGWTTTGWLAGRVDGLRR